MPISTLDELKENDLFIALNRIQSNSDLNDDSMKGNNFTRSPLHAIQFLVVYAGLDAEKRQEVVTNLSKMEFNDIKITKDQLDNLVDKELDWAKVLKQSSEKDTLNFDGTIHLNNSDDFYKEVEKNCPGLLKPMQSEDSLIKVVGGAIPGKVTFTTNVSQQEKWIKGFKEKGNYWEVEGNTQLSPDLSKTLNKLKSSDCTKINDFAIIKGHPDGEIILRLAKPKKNIFSVEKKTETELGIYGSFLGLKNFYGIEQVDDIKVVLESKAEFSKTGASTEQKQIVEFTLRGGDDDEMDFKAPTIITLESPPRMMFNKAGIFVDFAENPIKYSNFDSNIYITLGTKSSEKIQLFSTTPDSNAALSLAIGQEIKGNEQSVQQIVKFEKNPVKNSIKEEINELKRKEEIDTTVNVKPNSPFVLQCMTHLLNVACTIVRPFASVTAYFVGKMIGDSAKDSVNTKVQSDISIDKEEEFIRPKT